MDNKNQNNNTPSPDYSFILSQQPVGGEPKKRDKKVIVIFVLLAGLAAIILISVILSARSKVDVTDTPAAKTTSAQTFINSMAKPDADLAKEVHPQLTGLIAADKGMAVFNLQRIKGSIDFSKCQQKAENKTANGTSTTYQCISSMNKPVYVVIDVQASSNKVTAFKVKNEL